MKLKNPMTKLVTVWYDQEGNAVEFVITLEKFRYERLMKTGLPVQATVRIKNQDD